MKKVKFYTLGCKVNQYETDAMIELFKNRGYELSESDEKSDVAVINTCTVTNLSDRKSRQVIRKLKRENPETVIVVTGCYSQTATEEVQEIEEVDIIIGTNNRKNIIDYCEDFFKNKEKRTYVDDIMEVEEFEELKIRNTHNKTRAFLKIQEGCNQYCSYCIIPYARGQIRSRKLEDIVSETVALSEKGFKEVVLTGIHVASYGLDFEKVHTLIDVLKEVNKIDGIERIRLSSIEPNIITDEFLKEYIKLEKACHHFHLSLQSGDDEILKDMNRKYTTKEYKDIVEKLRNYIPGVSLTTDVIVGFPGETEENFKNTCNFIEEIGFSKIHIFQYSPRKGTPAAEFKNQIDGNTKQSRVKDLEIVERRKRLEYQKKYIGKKVAILVEDSLKENSKMVEGYTQNYIKVVFEGDIDKLKGHLQDIVILPSEDENLTGMIV